jgi:hypothetical protein
MLCYSTTKDRIGANAPIAYANTDNEDSCYCSILADGMTRSKNVKPSCNLPSEREGKYCPMKKRVHSRSYGWISNRRRQVKTGTG